MSKRAASRRYDGYAVVEPAAVARQGAGALVEQEQLARGRERGRDSHELGGGVEHVLDHPARHRVGRAQLPAVSRSSSSGDHAAKRADPTYSGASARMRSLMSTPITRQP